MKKLSLVLLITLSLLPVFSQNTAYKIDISLKGYIDTIAFLGHYYGNKLSVTDTAVAINEKIVFKGSEALKQGVYFFISGEQKKMFEFLIDSDQNFSFKTSLESPLEDMIIKGSEENTLFYDYLKYNRQCYLEIKSLQSSLSSSPSLNDSSAALVRQQIDSINTASIEYKVKLIKEYPESLTTLLFKAMREPEVPDFFLENGRHDTLSAYLYYRKHYWDNIDFSDDRFLRTPVFHKKLERYMTAIIPKQADSLIMEIDNMIQRTKENHEMREYLLWYFTNTYETSNIMGYDRIFVHMVDQYFTNTTYDWLNPVVQKNMIDRVNQVRHLLLGEYAPALIMADTLNELVSLHEIVADYIIVIFWSTTCGECKREVKTLNEFYRSTDLDLQIYAVNTDTAFSNWKNYISRKNLGWVNVNGNLSLTGDYHDLYDIYSTPVIYVLDDRKRIIAKRLAAESIPAFLKRHNKTKNQ
jgi:thiol-disulfide isomerase/thioredoxin